MKKLLCFTSLLIASVSFADQLHNYDQIKSAVTEGKLTRIVVDYSKCVITSEQKTIGNHNAIFTPNAMAITNDGGISSYLLYFTMNDPHYPGRGIYQYGKYLISKDNSLLITFSTLNAADFTALDGSVSLNCKIDDAAKIFSLG